MDEREQENAQRRDMDEGQKGGMTEAHLGAGTYAAAEPLAMYVGRVRWGAALAGVVVAISTMMLLASLGIAIGLTFGRFGPGGGLAYWVIGSAAIGLFLGSMLASRFGDVRNLWTAILHGVVVWSLFMILDRLGVDLIGGISRLLFAGAATAGVPGATTSAISTAGWWFFIGYLIALVAAVLGSVAGLAADENEDRTAREAHRAR